MSEQASFLLIQVLYKLIKNGYFAPCALLGILIECAFAIKNILWYKDPTKQTHFYRHFASLLNYLTK